MQQVKKNTIQLLISILVLFTLSACGDSGLNRISAQERLFLDLSLEYLGEYRLDDASYKDTPIGGLSAITYNRKNSRFYALSDDRSFTAPARFYTLEFSFATDLTGAVNFDKVQVVDVTFLKDTQGENFAPGTIDPEGIALSPQGTLFISSEGLASLGLDPMVGEFELATGKQINSLRLPDRYLPSANLGKEEPRGVQNNLAFESLTIKSSGLSTSDPFRLFTATESALLQDTLPPETEEGARVRLLHYLIQPIATPVLVAEHLYPLDFPPTGTLSNGLTELLAIEPEGFFLSLERTYGTFGFGAKIFQIATGNATDTSTSPTLKGNLTQVKPLRKQLVLDLGVLGIELDNLEGMTLGPRLPDGSQSLILVSDNNFKEKQVTQFLLFRLISR